MSFPLYLGLPIGVGGTPAIPNGISLRFMAYEATQNILYGDKPVASLNCETYSGQTLASFFDSPADVAAVAASCSNTYGLSHIVLDIEVPFETTPINPSYVSTLGTIINDFKSHGLRVGVYNAITTDFASVIPSCDAVYPSEYEFTTDWTGAWATAFANTVAACRSRFPGTPVVPFVCFNGIGNAYPLGQYVGDAAVTAMVQTAMQVADGLFIWYEFDVGGLGLAASLAGAGIGFTFTCTLPQAGSRCNVRFAKNATPAVQWQFQDSGGSPVALTGKSVKLEAYRPGGGVKALAFMHDNGAIGGLSVAGSILTWTPVAADVSVPQTLAYRLSDTTDNVELAGGTLAVAA